MSKGIDFDGSNKVLGPPSNMTEENCFNLPVKLGKDIGVDLIASVSAWEFDEQETAKMLDDYRNTGKIRVFLKVIGGQPAVYVTPNPIEEVEAMTDEEIKNWYHEKQTAKIREQK